MTRYALLVFALGCQSSNQAPDGGPSTDGSGSARLAIVSLTQTAPVLTGGAPDPSETDHETVVAIVTDTAGLDDIAGGELLDAAGRTYTAFGVGAVNSTFTAAIAYAQINQIDPIEFVGTGSRTLVAKFFSNSGGSTTMPLDVSLACRTGDGLVGSCAGTCTDTAVDAVACGACNHACGVGQVCTDGACSDPVIYAGGFMACVDTRSSIGTTTCNDLCARDQMTCNPQDALNGLFGYDSCTGNGLPTLGCTHAVGTVGTAFFACGCTP